MYRYLNLAHSEIIQNISLFVFVPLVLIMFFAPLRNIHRDMVVKGKQYQASFEDQVTELKQKIQTHLDKMEVDKAEDAKKALDIRQAMYPGKPPTWPFDFSIILRFVTPQLVPIVGLIIRLSDPIAQVLNTLLAAIIQSGQ